MTDDKKKVILIVDDDEGTHETFVELFKENNYEVIQAFDGVEGLDIATSKEGIDVIFTGIIMPRMDGFQLVQALKENTVTASIPIVMNSHLGREEDRKKAIELGVKDFIIRGLVSPLEVVKRVTAVFSIQGKEYFLKVDPYELDSQVFIEEMGIPQDFKCTNCGSQLAEKIVVAEDTKLITKIACPNCKSEY